MKSFHRVLAVRLSALTVAASAIALAACSSGSSGASGGEETTQSTSSADTIGQDFTLQQTNLNVLRAEATNGMKITVANGSLQIVLPQLLTEPPFNVKPIAPIAIPAVPFTVKGYSATATCTSFTVDTTTITATLTDTGIAVSAYGYGAFQVSSDVVNPVVSISATVSASLNWNPSADQFVLVPDSLTATSSNVATSGCGEFGWCDGIVDDYVDLNSMLQSYAVAPLSAVIATPAVASAFYGALGVFADLQAPPPSNQTGWVYTPHSGYLGNYDGSPVFDFAASAVNYPAVTPPPNCTASRDCTGDEFIYCAEVPNPVTQTVSGGTLISSGIVVGQNGYTVTPGAYTVCDADSYNPGSGPVCQSIPEPPPPASCISCPRCETGQICEILNGVGTCVKNERCQVGYHYCNNECVKGVGLCP